MPPRCCAATGQSNPSPAYQMGSPAPAAALPNPRRRTKWVHPCLPRRCRTPSGVPNGFTHARRRTKWVLDPLDWYALLRLVRRLDKLDPNSTPLMVAKADRRRRANKAPSHRAAIGRRALCPSDNRSPICGEEATAKQDSSSRGSPTTTSTSAPSRCSLSRGGTSASFLVSR